MSGVQIRVCGRYKLESLIKKSDGRSIYLASNVQTKEQVVVKAEEAKARSPIASSLLAQGKALQTMQGGIGIAAMHWCGQEEDYNFIVMECLGKNLQELLEICGGRFSLKTVLMIADQAVNIMQYFHFKNFVHRALKPCNFIFGVGKKNHKLHLIDFSSTKRYRDHKTLEHIPYKEVGFCIDNILFSSLNVNSGIQATRRDDIESLLYMLIFFLKGELPWQAVMRPGEESVSKSIFSLKSKTSPEDLTAGLPKEFCMLLKYVRGLEYEEKPDYTYIRNIFKERMDREGMINDSIYDWVLIPPDLSSCDFPQHVPLSIEIIPNEQEFIKTHLEQFGKANDAKSDELLQNTKNEANAAAPASKEPAQKGASTNKDPRSAASKAKKDCLIF